MARKKTTSASGTKRSYRKKRPADGHKTLKKYEQPFYSRRKLQSLQVGIKGIYRLKGYNVDVVESVLSRLTTSLRLLDSLHGIARRVLSGDLQAARKFYRRLSDLSVRFPGQGSTRILLDRAGSRRDALVPRYHFSMNSMGFGPQFGPQTDPCGGILNLPGMAELYGAVYAVFGFNLGELTQPPSNELTQAVDTVAGLRLGHGHLEVLNNKYQKEGIRGLAEAVEWAELSENPYLGAGAARLPGHPTQPMGSPGDHPRPVLGFGESGDLTGFMPDPGNGPFQPLSIDSPYPEACEMALEACEGILIDIFNRGAPAMPPQTRSTWAHNIDHIEHNGLCEGNVIVIHGSDFGDTQPDHVKLVMKIDGVCEEVFVYPDDWSDTRIEVILPEDVSPGAVGFYNPDDNLSRELYNGWVGQVNNDLRNINVASRCLGTPFEFPLLPPLTGKSKCAPETEVNFIDAGVPVIHAFDFSIEAGVDNRVVIEPNDALILTWQVQNADTIELRRVSPTGPDFEGNNAVTNPPGESYNLGLAGHQEATIFRYRLSATNPCGTSLAEVEIYASKRPGLEIDKIEVTQSIQTLDHDVRLIKHKHAVTRVYATHQLEGFTPDDAVPGLKGRMRVHKESGFVTPWFDPINGSEVQAPDPPLMNSSATIDLPAVIDRTETDHTLNFLIPAGFCEGTIRIEVEIFVDNFGAPPGRSGIDERIGRIFEDFTFHERRALKIRFIPATVNLNSFNAQISVLPGFSNPPTDAQCLDFLREVFKYYPSTPDSIGRLEGHQVTIFGGRVVITTEDGDFPIDLGALPISTESVLFDVHANVILEWYGVLRGCDFLDFTGAVCPNNDDEIWVILVPVGGIWGRAHWAADVSITPMNTATAAHEIAHTLNQAHITPADCSGGGSAVGNDPTSDPDTWDDGGEIVPDKIVPFDIIRNRTITGGSDGVWDLMTYCGTRWTHPQRWDMLYDEIGD